MPGTPYVAVVGPAEATDNQTETAQQLGSRLAQGGAIVVCGGLGGVMAGACRGAREAGGLTVGVLPGTDRSAANPWVSVAIPTGVGELRNGLVARAADVVVAVGGAHGTLSEIALALKMGIPVIGLDSWSIEGVQAAGTPAEAAQRALELAAQLVGSAVTEPA